MKEENTTRQHVTVNKGQAHFEALKWLAKAISKDQTRYQLTFLNCEVDGEKVILVSTDGRRLHKLETTLAKLPDMATGGYTVKISSRDVILVPESLDRTGNSPNWRRVVPAYEEDSDQTGIVRASVTVTKDDSISRLTALLNSKNQSDGVIYFDDRFLSEALGEGTIYGARGSYRWDCAAKGLYPLVITSVEGDNLQAVIMPLRW